MSFFKDKTRPRFYLTIVVCVVIVFVYHKTYGGSMVTTEKAELDNTNNNLDALSQQYSNLMTIVQDMYRGSQDDKTYESKEQEETSDPVIDSTTPIVTKCEPSQRRDFVRRQCKLLNYYNPGSVEYTREHILDMTPERRRKYTNNLLVDDKHKVLFCSNAKVGATTYKYLLVAHADNIETNADGKPDVKMGAIHGDGYLEKYNLTCGGKFSDEEMKYRLENYRKVMTVRDPLLRVYSSYREKLATVKPPKCQPYQKGLGSRILEMYRGNLTEAEQQCGYTVTPAEFIRYIASEDGQSLLRGDPHWNQYYLKCQPCVVDYDYYIRIETGDSDQEHFLNEYLHSENPDSFIGSEVRFNNVGKSSETVLAENAYEQLSTGYKGVDRKDFEKIEEHFRIDSVLFGYTQTLSNKGMTSKCRSSDSTDIRQCC